MRPQGSVLILSAALAVGSTPAAQTPADPAAIAALDVGRSVERAFARHETHAYRLRLTGDSYTELRVEQRDLELSVRLLNADGSEVVRATDPTGPSEVRIVSFIAPSTGDYRVEVSPAARTAFTGGYAIRTTALR